MKKVFLLLTGLLCLVGSVLSAQTIKVSGTVTDASDGLPLPGAYVLIQGTATGIVTNDDGTFTLSCPADATLVVTYIGYQSADVQVNGRTELAIALHSANVLDEVVVTALGISREKKALGYAIQSVKSEELTKGGNLSVTSSLTGKMAGVQINTFGGTVGASSRISIRGNSSLSANQQPLIVLNGVPLTNDTQRSGDGYYNGVDYGSGLNDINPEDIESITVLKGGSAALYGMLAGNGVVLITTKSGKQNDPGVQVSYDGNFTIDRISTLPRLQNLYGQGSDGSEWAFAQYGAAGETYQHYAENSSFSYVDGLGSGVNDGYDESWGPRLDVGLKLKQFDSPVDANGNRTPTPWISQPNNVRDFFQTGFSMNHTVSLLSATANSSTRASISVRDQKGTVPNTDQRRYSGQVNTTFRLNKWVSFEMSSIYTRTESDNLLGQGYGSNNPINSLTLWSARQMNMQSLKDNWDQKDAAGEFTYYNWNGNYHMNPYFTVNMNTNSYQRDRVFGKGSIFVEPIKGLKFEGRIGIDYYSAESFERHYREPDYYNGAFLQRNMKNTEFNADFVATYNKEWNKFSLAAVAGANYRNLNYSFHELGADELTVLGVYTINNKVGDAVTGMSHSHIRSNSVYGQVSLGFDRQIYLDASIRNDWSSTIRDPFFYPSVSLSWILTESFEGLKGSFLSFLKLRGGWAKIGSATSAYRNRAYYYAGGSFGGVAMMYKSFQYPNESLRPEMVKTWETGLEAAFFNDRLRLDAAYYQKFTTDQILSVSTSNTIGFNSMLVNAGNIENKGVELQLSADIIRHKDGFNWTTTINATKDWNRINELYNQDGIHLETASLGWTWGISTIAKEGSTWGDIQADGYARVEEGPHKGAIIVNSAGLPRTVGTAIIGNVKPDFMGGWSNEFSYKGLSFGFFLDLRLGGDIWSQSMSHGYTAGTAYITAENGIRERDIVLGKDVFTHEKFVKDTGNGTYVENDITTNAQMLFESGGCSETYVFDGSFLKLREAHISYNFPKKVLGSQHILKKASISLIGNNLALLWVHKSNTMRLDPEAGGVNSNSYGIGFEQASVPHSRSFGLKVNLTF